MVYQPQPDEPLHQATDLLNRALMDAEDALSELGLGVTASVALDEGQTLYFRKKGSEWALVVTRPDDPNGTALLQASRKTRLDAAGKLPALRDALVDSYGIELHRVQDAIKAVEAFTASLQSQRRPHR